MQLEIGPERPDHADRHIDPEHQAPIGVGQHAADHEAKELAADESDDIDAEREPSLFAWKGIGEKRGGIGHDQRAADTLHDAHRDQIDGGEIAGPRQDREGAVAAAVKMAKPRLYIRARPNWSPSRPKATTRTPVAIM